MLKLKEKYLMEKVVCPLTRRVVTMNFVEQAAYVFFAKYFPQFFTNVKTPAVAAEENVDEETKEK